MKKKQVALLLAALMCITSVAESAAVMGAEFSSGEETVEMQGTEEEAEAEDTAEIWTSGEEVSDFGTDEAPEVDGFTSEESEASTDAAGAKQVKGSFEVAYITEEQYNNALQNEERPEVDMKTVEDTTFSSALNSIEGENTGYCFVSVQDLEDAADFVAPEGMTVLVENARARSITPNGNIAFWGMIDPPETIEIKEGKGTTAFFCQDMRSVLKGTGSDDKVIFCGQNNAIGGISGVENIYLRNNSHDLQVFGASEFFNIYNETDNIKNNPQEENAFFIHIVNSKTAPVFHKTFDWGTGEFENENGEKWSSPYGIGIIYNTSDEKSEWEDIPVPAGTQAVKYDMSDEDIVEMLSRIWVYSEDGTTQDMNGKIWNPDKDNAVDLQEFRDCEGMSAKEIFEAHGRAEFPDGGCVWINVAPTAQAERYINAYQKKNNASGYYLMNMKANTKISGKQTAQLYIGGALKLGTYETEGETYSRNLIVRQFDTKEAQAAGVPVSKDCFDPTYRYAWDETEDNDWFYFTKIYKNEEINLVTVNASLDEEYSTNRLLAQFRFDVNGEKKYGVVLPRYIHLDEFEGLTAGIDGNKHRLFYVDWWTNEEKIKAVEIPAYYEFSGQSLNSIASAQISTIKTQLYTGKALKPSVTVTLNGKKLKAGTDYTVSYANNTKAGSTASVIITGKGNYVGTAIQNFEIAAIPAKGKVYTSGNLKYKVTKSAYKNGTVSVYAPAEKTLTSASVPATVKINGYTFNVTAIGDKAFNGCTKLKKVTIGSKVTTIGKQAFNGCKALTSITVNSKVLKTVGASALKGISAKAVIKVPAAKLSAYQKLFKGKGQKNSVKITK